MTKIAITGLSGVIGSVLIEEFSESFEIIDLFHKSRYKGKINVSNIKLDLLNKASIPLVLKKINPDVIIHMASITHIDRCEINKKFGKKGFVWKVNVDATREIVKFCESNKTHLIYLSTECVFNGNKIEYSEKSKKDPKNWYGYTKSCAEDIIINSKSKNTIIRSVVAYSENDKGKTIYGKILKTIDKNKLFFAADDVKFTPTHTKDIVKSICLVLQDKKYGIFHVSPKTKLSPYEFAVIVAEKNNKNIELIQKITVKKLYGIKKAKLRLKNSCLDGRFTNKLLNISPAEPQDIL